MKPSALYGILDDTFVQNNTFVETTEAFLNTGVKTLELKLLNHSTGEIYQIAKRLMKLKNKYKFTLLTYGHPDVVKLLHLDGIHLDKSHLHYDDVRSYLDPEQQIGLSCYSKENAFKAAKKGADFITIGPLFPSESPHLGDYETISLEDVKLVVDQLSIPIIAFGGINLTNILQVFDTGVTSMAMVSDILKDAAPSKKLEMISALFRGHYNKKKLSLIDHSEHLSRKVIPFLREHFHHIFDLEIISPGETHFKDHAAVYVVEQKKMDTLPPWNELQQQGHLSQDRRIVLTDFPRVDFMARYPEINALAILDIRDQLQFQILSMILQSLGKKKDINV